jgi:UDPglucose 6-dehydrogenase
MTATIKIYGYGWVGKAMKSLFPDARVHDPLLNLTDFSTTDVSFICVPTPLRRGTLDCSIVEQTVKECDSSLIIIRSTVLPGTTDRLAFNLSKHVLFQPEYLGETVQHPMTDQRSRPFLILGGTPQECRHVIELYHSVYNSNILIRTMSAYEAEVVKLSENRAIAFKVAQCQELYDVCEAAGIDYYKIRDAVYGDDPRFNLWWTFVYPEKRGFNSKCIPKDVYGWAAWAESLGVDPLLTNTLLSENEKLIASNENVF